MEGINQLFRHYSLQESFKSKKDRVEQLLNTLALQGCRNTCIGDALSRGISGGQAKRTNVGIALITNPKVLFLDGTSTAQSASEQVEFMVSCIYCTMIGSSKYCNAFLT